MKTLIIISNVPKPEFKTRIPKLKALVNNPNIINWSDLPFLNRTLIISNDEINSFKLLNFLKENKVSLGLTNYNITIKENFTTISDNLQVDKRLDMNFENVVKPAKPDLKVDTNIRINHQLPSPTITITPIDNV